MALTGTDAFGTGPYNPGTTILTASNNLAVYEILWADPFSIETADISYTLVGAPPGMNLQITAGYAPFYSDEASAFASATDPVPRFVPILPLATRFAVSAAPIALLGMPFSFTVTALDSTGNVVTNYPDLVALASPSGTTNLGYLTNGVGTFSTEFSLPVAQTLTVADASFGSIRGMSGTINVPGVLVNLTSAPEGIPFDISGSGCQPGGYVTPATLAWYLQTACSVTFEGLSNAGTSAYEYQFATINGGAATRANPVVLNSGTSALNINAT
jgi:hypothetical protein